MNLETIEKTFTTLLKEEKSEIIKTLIEKNVDHKNIKSNFTVKKEIFRVEREVLDVSMICNSGDIRTVEIFLYAKIDNKISKLSLKIEDSAKGAGIYCKFYDKETYDKRHHGFSYTGQPHTWQALNAYQNVEYKMRFDNKKHTFYNLKISEEILEILEEISKQFVRTEDEVVEYFYNKNFESRKQGFLENKREIKRQGWGSELDDSIVKAYLPELTLKDTFHFFELTHTYKFRREYIPKTDTKDSYYDEFHKTTVSDLEKTLNFINYDISENLFNIEDKNTQLFIRFDDSEKDLIISNVDNEIIMKIISSESTILEDIKIMKKILRDLSFDKIEEKQV
jgi:hypothetical protein